MISVAGSIRVDAYRVLAQAVETGVAYGYQRAYKHVEFPDGDTIRTAIEQAVMNELCEWLRFDDADDSVGLTEGDAAL